MQLLPFPGWAGPPADSAGQHPTHGRLGNNVPQAGGLSSVSGVFPQVPMGVAEVLLPAEQDKYSELVMGGTSVGDSVT